MQVAIDISSIPYGRGVSRYTSNLVRALLEHTDIKLSLYGNSLRQYGELEKFIKQLRNTKKTFSIQHSTLNRLPPSLINLAWQFNQLKVKKQLPNIDVFHSWDWMQPPDKDLPLVSTIHDLAILKFPETAHPKIVKQHERTWKILQKRQAQIIAVSQATKNDLIELLDWNPKYITVIHEALPVETKQVADNLSEEDFERIKKRLKLDQPFILFVGTREPRKNLYRLIKAWEPLAKDFQLIIAGESGWDETSSSKELKLSQNARENLRFLGRVEDSELVVLYSEANAFAYPSLYEGFGLPILESFSFGTPVLTSNVSSLPEVAGNAAILVEPKSIESIRGGLEKLLGESKAKQDKRLQQMIIRLHQFSWEKVARQTAGVYGRTK